MIPAWLTVAEAWLVAMCAPGADVERCYARHVAAMWEVAVLVGEPFSDSELDALANRGVW